MERIGGSFRGHTSICREVGRLTCKGLIRSTWVAVQGAHHHLQESWHGQEGCGRGLSSFAQK